MTTARPAWPVKTRDIHNHHMDSTAWDGFRFRDGDIIVGTYGKSGTTWLQQIVSQLIFNGAEGLPVAEMSPWVDLRVPPKEVKLPQIEAQDHRRFLKTHLPVDALVFSPKAKYIYIGRDGRDVVWSLYNHHAKANALFYEAINDTPGLVGPRLDPPPASIRQYYADWFAGNGYPFWPFWENIRSWWEIRDLPNVMLLHFNDLKADMPGTIRKIASFLDIPVDEAAYPEILEHCSFAYMKAHADATVPMGGALWDGGAQVFVHKGENGRWRDVLSAEECAAYDQRALAELGPECAHWLETGVREQAAATA